MRLVQHFAFATLATALQRQPLSPGKIRMAWRLAAGPAADKVTTALEVTDGVLVATVPDERWRVALTRSGALLRPRLQEVLGAEAVATIAIRPSATPDALGRSSDGRTARRADRPVHWRGAGKSRSTTRGPSGSM